MIKLEKERIYLHAPDACVIAAVEISPAPDMQELESAIIRACSRHGALAKRIMRRTDGSAAFEDCELMVGVASAELESEYDWLIAAEEERRSPFDIEAGELIRFTVFTAPDKVQLMAAMHRIAGDEKSLMLLMGDIAAALADASLEFEPLAMEQIDQAALAGRKLSGMPAMMVKMCNKRWVQQGRGFSNDDYLKLCEKAAEIPAPVAYCREFTADMSARISDACRAHGVRMRSAVAAALAIAWKQPCEIGFSTSLREKGELRCGDYSTSVAIAADPRAKEFWQVAREVDSTLAAAEKNPEKRDFLMRFMNAVEPTLTDAVWYQQYGAVRHPMVAQLGDMLGFGSHAKSFSMVGVSAALEGGKYSWDSLWLLPPNIPNAQRTAALVQNGGVLTVTMQAPDDDLAEEAGERFEDAMMLLEESTVAD